MVLVVMVMVLAGGGDGNGDAENDVDRGGRGTIKGEGEAVRGLMDLVMVAGWMLKPLREEKEMREKERGKNVGEKEH